MDVSCLFLAHYSLQVTPQFSDAEGWCPAECRAGALDGKWRRTKGCACGRHAGAPSLRRETYLRTLGSFRGRPFRPVAPTGIFFRRSVVDRMPALCRVFRVGSKSIKTFFRKAAFSTFRSGQVNETGTLITDTQDQV